MCEEMIKLRKWLDKQGIKWWDKSETYDERFFIHRTKFIVDDREFSVINGYGTYGGISSQYRKNVGLLEMWVDYKGEPKGYLTADDVIREIG